MRAGAAAVRAVLVLLGGLPLVTQRRTADLARRAQTANRLGATLQDARHWAGEEKSVEREYRRAGSYSVREEHAAAGRRLVAALRSAARLDGSAAGRREVATAAGPPGGRARPRALTPDNTADRRRSAGESRAA
jgi:hypothetical protein